MGWIAYGLRSIVEFLVTPFDWLPETLGLTLIGVLTGLGMLWVVGKTSSQKRLEVVRRKMASAIYEMRLFLDSPGRVFRAQGRLLGGSFVYVALLLPSLLVLSLPLGVLYLHLEPRHGLAPLSVGQPVVIAVDLESGVDGYTVEAPELPPGVSMSAPVLVSPAENRAYLRVSLLGPGTYELSIQVAGKGVSKRLSTTDAFPVRTRGLSSFWEMGSERPIPSDLGVTSISVDHPSSEQSWLGLGIPWWLYWLIIATIAALALRRPLDVVL